MDERSVHRIVAEIAGRQGGAVSRAELILAGVTCAEIEHMLGQGSLVPIARGVYAYGISVLTQRTVWWTGLMLGGRGARLGQRSALEAQAVLPSAPREATIAHPRRSGHGTRTVTLRMPTEAGLSASIRLVPSKHLASPLLVDGIWCDPIVRAFDDLAAKGAAGELRKAWREADYRGLLSGDAVREQLRRGSAGSGMLRTLLHEIPIVGDEDEVLSRAERHLLEALSRTKLPFPVVNRRAKFGERFLRPDFWFVLAKLIVEVDGPQHKLPARAAEDAERDAFLTAAGFEVLRFSDEDVWKDVDACVAQIAERATARAS